MLKVLHTLNNLFSIQATGVASLCALGDTHLRDMKRIAYHFSQEDISCLENLNENAVTTLGSLEMWTEEQAMQFASKYMTDNIVASPAELNVTHLTALGHFICGLPADDIQQIPPDQYVYVTHIFKTCD